MGLFLEMLPLTFFNTVYFFISFKNISPAKFNKREIFVFIVGCTVLGTLSCYIHAYCVHIVNFAVSSTFLTKKIHKNPFCYILPIYSILFSFVADYLAGNILALILQVDIKIFLEESETNLLILMTTSLVIVYVISRIIGYILIEKIKIQNLFYSSRQLSAILVLLLSNTVLVVFQAYVGKIYLNNTIIAINSIITIAHFLVINTITFYLMSTMNKDIEIRAKEIELKSQKEALYNLQLYLDKIESVHKDFRSFRHDFHNILITLSTFISQKRYEELEVHFFDKIFPMGKKIYSESLNLSVIENLKIPEVKGFVAIKIIEAETKGVFYKVEIIEEILEIKMDILDICRALGIIFDNAQEEAVLCAEPDVNFAIVRHKNSKSIILSNSCANSQPDVNKIFKEGFTTKGGKERGMGLCNLEDILSKYENASLDVSTKENWFQIIINIYED